MGLKRFSKNKKKKFNLIAAKREETWKKKWSKWKCTTYCTDYFEPYFKDRMFSMKKCLTKDIMLNEGYIKK